MKIAAGTIFHIGQGWPIKFVTDAIIEPIDPDKSLTPKIEMHIAQCTPGYIPPQNRNVTEVENDRLKDMLAAQNAQHAASIAELKAMIVGLGGKPADSGIPPAPAAPHKDKAEPKTK